MLDRSWAERFAEDWIAAWNSHDLDVILAFAVGAQLAGVIGALIALPLAALYPTIERLWLREQLPEETVAEHHALTRSSRA